MGWGIWCQVHQGSAGTEAVRAECPTGSSWAPRCSPGHSRLLTCPRLVDRRLSHFHSVMAKVLPRPPLGHEPLFPPNWALNRMTEGPWESGSHKAGTACFPDTTDQSVCLTPLDHPPPQTGNILMFLWEQKKFFGIWHCCLPQDGHRPCL